MSRPQHTPPRLRPPLLALAAAATMVWGAGARAGEPAPETAVGGEVAQAATAAASTPSPAAAATVPAASAATPAPAPSTPAPAPAPAFSSHPRSDAQAPSTALPPASGAAAAPVLRAASEAAVGTRPAAVAAAASAVRAAAPNRAASAVRAAVAVRPAASAAALPGADPATLCAVWVQRLPNVNQAVCEAAGLAPNTGRSARGLPLFQRDVVSRDVSAQPRARVLVIGGIHGDELSSASLVLHWIAHAQRDAAAVEWRFVPLVNPDGALQKKPTRVNARGVDLNRNFPTADWARLAPRYWAEHTKRDPRRYPGPAPLSEPESRWLFDEMERWRPDLVVSVHAPYGVLDFDGPSAAPRRLGRLVLEQIGVYPGSLGNYGGLHKGVPVVTIELPSAFRTPTDAEMRQMWQDLLSWIAERVAPSRAQAQGALGGG